MKRKTVWLWVKVLVILYCVVGLGIYLLQDYIMLVPKPLPDNYKYSFDFPFREVNIPYEGSTNINIIEFQPADTVSKGVVLYFHGNRTNISRYRRFAPYFTKSGYEVWMIDYPGYGKSTGKFSEKTVYEWSQILYDRARKKFPPEKIVILGKSLGTGIASRLASIRDCRYLILETPYYSMPDVFGYYAPIYPVKQMIRHRFPTYSYIPHVAEPIIIFHGTSDGVIPYRHSLRLQKLLKPADKLITLEGGSHNDLFRFPQVASAIDSLLGLQK